MKKILKLLTYGFISLSLFNQANAMEELDQNDAIEIKGERNIGAFEALPNEIMHRIFLSVIDENLKSLNMFTFCSYFLNNELNKTRLISKYFANVIQKKEFADLAENRLERLVENLQEFVSNVKKTASYEYQGKSNNELNEDLITCLKAYLNTESKIKTYGILYKITMLIMAGADVDIKDSYTTALHFAARDGFIGMVKILIELGANTNVQNNIGVTPLMLAAFNNHAAIVRLLREKGADIDTKNDYGETAFITAAAVINIYMMKLLKELGADINIKNKFGDTALKRAIDLGKIETVKALKELGVDTKYCLR